MLRDGANIIHCSTEPTLFSLPQNVHIQTGKLFNVMRKGVSFSIVYEFRLEVKERFSTNSYIFLNNESSYSAALGKSGFYSFLSMRCL